MTGGPEETRYLSVADVTALHGEMMRRLGAAPAPLRDERLLESAIMRPQTAAHYESADLIRQAALLAAGIIQNHPYVDGNKRTAAIAAATFLDRNGYDITVRPEDPLEIAWELEAIATRRAAGATLEEATGPFEAWLRAHVTPLTGE